MNNGSANLVQLAREPLDRGVIVGGELRDVPALAQTSIASSRSTSCRGVGFASGFRRIGSAFAASTSTGSPTTGSSRTRSGSGLTRPSRFRSTKRCSTTTWSARSLDEIGRRLAADRPGRGLPRIDRPLSRSVQGGRGSSSTGSTSRRLRCYAPQARLRPVSDEATSAVVAVSLGHDRSTLAISDGEVCEFMRVLEWGGGKLETAIALEPRPHLRRGARPEARVPRWSPTTRPTLDPRAWVPSGKRSDASSRSLLGSSWPRSSSTRPSRDLWRSPRFSSRAARVGCPACRRSWNGSRGWRVRRLDPLGPGARWRTI